MDFNKRIITIEKLCEEIAQKAEILKGLENFTKNIGSLDKQSMGAKGEYAYMMTFLHDSLVNDFYLSLGWLIDNDTENELKKTISIYQLIKEYKNTHQDTCDQIKLILQKHADTIKKIKNKRNKLIAHYDLTIYNNNDADKFTEENSTSHNNIISLIKDIMPIINTVEFRLMSAEFTHKLLEFTYNTLN